VTNGGTTPTIPVSLQINGAGYEYTVTAIGQGSYTLNSSATSVTSVTFATPSNVTSINAWAFKSFTGLSSITAPNSVTSIGYKAFYGCTSALLTSIVIPDTV